MFQSQVEIIFLKYCDILHIKAWLGILFQSQVEIILLKYVESKNHL